VKTKTVKWHVSASQAKTAKACIRKWFYEKVEGRTTPVTDALRIGKEHSEHVEQYLLGQRDPEHCVELAQIGFSLLPKPGDPDMLVEHECRAPAEFLCEYAGIPMINEFRYGEYVGYIDLLITREDHREIIDHKTRGSARWALTEADLLADYQMNLYAAWCQAYMPALFGGDEVNIAHINYLKNGRRGPRGLRAFKRDATATPETIKPVIADIVSDTLRMIDARSSDKLPDGDPTYQACKAFGGCPHRAYCDHYQSEFGGSVFARLEKGTDMSNENEDFFNTLFGGDKEQPEDQPKPAESSTSEDFEPTIGVLTPEADAEFSEVLSQTAEAQPTPEPDHNDVWEGYPTRWVNRVPQGVTPDVARHWTLEQFLEINGLGEGTARKVMAMLGADSQPVEATAIKQAAREASHIPVKFTLCVDCAPARGDVDMVYVDDLAYLAGERATAQHGRYYMALPYNEGKVTAAEILLPMLESEIRKWGSGVYVVASSRHPLWAYLTDYLTHHATLTIKA
jgi:hypothetical protein